MFGQAEPGEHVIGQTTEQAVYLGQGNARIGERIEAGAGGKLDRTPAGHRADPEGRRADNRGCAGPPAHLQRSLTLRPELPSVAPCKVPNECGAMRWPTAG